VSEHDQLRRFLFEDAPLRGHWVRLEDAWREAREHQQLPPAVRELLGEALAATVLLAGSLKFNGTLTLQLQGGNGLVPMLVAQATSELTLRGVAHVDPQALDAGMADDADFAALVGDGQMVISVEQGEGASPWQGIVPLVGSSLSACLEQYFEASEQVATSVSLAASDFSAAGVLLQKLPTPGGPGEAGEAQLRDLWEEAAAMLATRNCWRASRTTCWRDCSRATICVFSKAVRWALPVAADANGLQPCSSHWAARRSTPSSRSRAPLR
jgi:molecular chaperone Hsp33